MRLGIFGGTFDPPHIGHQILAAEALEQLNLDLILWVLTHYPPHKLEQKITSLSDRIEMVQLSIMDNPGFMLSRVDIDRDPPHYALDTVMLVKEKYTDDAVYYLMGMDSLNDLPTWHKPTEFVRICDGIAVMHRRGESQDLIESNKEINGLEKKLVFLETPIIDVSSSEIRTRIILGKQFRYFLPNPVYQYIISNHLYLD